MNREALEKMLFKVRLLRDRAQEIRTELVSALGSDDAASMLALDLLVSSADLCAALSALQPAIEVPRETIKSAKEEAL